MIKRKLLSSLIDHLPAKEMSLIVGPRQAGKTTLMNMLKQHAEGLGGSTLFLNLDVEADRDHFSSQESLINKIRLEIGEKKGYVFIDEMQRKENAGLFLKGLYDLNLPYKFIVSGSGSLELKEKIHESLAGRKRLFALNTVSFDEFVHFRTEYRYEEKLHDFFSLEKERTKSLLVEYLNFGGYPRSMLETRLSERIKIMDDIYQSYLERDISCHLRVEKLDAFSALIKVLAGQIGKAVNFAELSSTLGISSKTVQDYFRYAEKTFVLRRITPYFTNIRKELSKSPTVYLYDLGLRNYALGLFGHLTAHAEFGFLFQNFVLHILEEKLRFTSGEIHFWRTKDRAEVDFVVTHGKTLIPVETKFKEAKSQVMGRSLHSFILKYEPKRAFVINLGLRKKEKVGRTEVVFMPFYDLYRTDLAPVS